MKKVALYILFGFLMTGCSGGAGGSPAIKAEVPSEQPSFNGTTPTASTNVQKLTYKIGPFNLASGTDPQSVQESPAFIQFSVEEPLWITSFEPKMEDSSGKELPNSLLFFAILSNSSETNPLCKDAQVANPFAAATSVTKKVELPEDHGYPVLPTDILDARVVLQNKTTTDYNNVFFVFSVTAVPMKSSKKMNDVFPMLLETDPCNNTPMAVAPKEFSQKQATFKVPENGLLTKAYGLLQDDGVEVSLSAKDQQTPFWTAKATLSPDHQLIDLPPFEDPAGISFSAGDDISLSVAYDNPGDSWITNATGAVMAYVKRTEDYETKERREKENNTTAETTPAADVQKMLIK